MLPAEVDTEPRLAHRSCSGTQTGFPRPPPATPPGPILGKIEEGNSRGKRSYEIKNYSLRIARTHVWFR